MSKTQNSTNLTTLFDKYYSIYSANMSPATIKFFSSTLVLKKIDFLTGPNVAADLIKSKDFSKMPMEKKMEYIQVMLNTACDELGIAHMELHVRQRPFWQKFNDTGFGEESFGACVIYDSVDIKTIVEIIAHEAFHQYVKSMYNKHGISADNEHNAKLGKKRAYITDDEEYQARWFGVAFAEKYGHPTNKERWNKLEKKYDKEEDNKSNDGPKL